MEKKAASPRRQASVMGAQNMMIDDTHTEDVHPAKEDPPLPNHGEREASPVPQVNRSVKTRTETRITLPLDLMGLSNDCDETPGRDDQRGWRSPHGEPYRPLGNPELNLKFTPRVSNRMKIFSGVLPIVKDQGEARSPARTVTQSPNRPSVRPKLNVLDMFPPNLHKRSPDDRMVKLAHRLHESMAQYSPENTHGVRSPRRSPQKGLSPRADGDGNYVSPEKHQSSSQQGDTSVHLLHEAIAECSSRVQLVRNGMSFLEQVPTTESLNFAVLQQEYEHARERYIVAQENRKIAGRLSKQVKQDNPDQDSENTHRSSTGPESELYLPYTTRLPQPPPHTGLPSYAEFKVKAREHRTQVRQLRSSIAFSGSPGEIPGRRSSARPSRLNSMLLSLSNPLDGELSPRLASPRRSFTAAGAVVINQTSSSPSKTGMNVIAEGSDDDPTLSRADSVIRLQSTIDSIEEVKESHAKMLMETLETLNKDRRDCLMMKYKNFVLEDHIDADIMNMRMHAEHERVLEFDQSMSGYHWFPDLLRLMVARESSLHPAEAFVIQVIRRIASEGHSFKEDCLYKVVLLLHPEDVALSEMQQLLTFLRRALNIPLPEWEQFFQTHRLPEPCEVFKQKEVKKEKKQVRMAKLRAVVRMSQVLRRFGTPATP